MRTQARVVFRPVLAACLPGAVAGATDAAAPATVGTVPAALAYAAKDLQDWARFCGVRIASEGREFAAPEWAQRGAVVAAEAGRAQAYLDAIFRARFTELRDISDRAIVLGLAAQAGLDPPAFAARMDSAATLDALRANGDELQRRGGYATPTMFITDDMYVGHARVPLLESALVRASDRPFVAPGEHDRA
jgi:2-hydroxychromene-2-carboxylate isomerase